MDEATYAKAFHPSCSVQPIISHLLYANDLMIFGKSMILNASTLRLIFHKLGVHAGLMVNATKAKVFFSDYVNNA